jgi:hypothetical protein
MPIFLLNWLRLILLLVAALSEVSPSVQARPASDAGTAVSRDAGAARASSSQSGSCR